MCRATSRRACRENSRLRVQILGGFVVTCLKPSGKAVSKVVRQMYRCRAHLLPSSFSARALLAMMDGWMEVNITVQVRMQKRSECIVLILILI